MKRFQSIVIGLLLFAGFCVCSYYEHNYTRAECVVTDVTSEGIKVMDKAGEIWECDSKEQFAVGDVVDLKMNDNCTSSYIYDDIIRGIKKSK